MWFKRCGIVLATALLLLAIHVVPAGCSKSSKPLVSVFATPDPIFDTERPIRATGDMLPWYTGKACEHVNHSHVNMAVFDSRWEASEAFELDRSPLVAAWAKNDHLGFEITYSFRGIIRKFLPVVRLANRKMLVLEVKGQDNQEQLFGDVEVENASAVVADDKEAVK